MIELYVEIDVLGTGGSDLTAVSISKSGNNISSDISTVMGKFVAETKPFILGKSKLGSGDTFCSSVPYYIGGQLTDANGSFATAYSLTVEGSDAFNISFSDKAYPTSISVDGTSYENSSSQFAVSGLSGTSHTVVISGLNKANENLVILGVFSSLKINGDISNIISFSATRADRADHSQPSYGLVSSGGSMELSDSFGEILNIISKYRMENKRVEAYIKNGGKKQKIFTKTISTIEYDNYNKEVSIGLEENIVNSQKCAISNPYANYKFIESNKLYDIFKSNINNVMKNNGFDVRHDSDFENYVNSNCSLPSGKVEFYRTTISNDQTAWNLLDNFCKSTLSHAYENVDGIITLVANDGD